MASQGSHPVFPPRSTYAQPLGKLPDRSANFGPQVGHVQRDVQRQERERERAERERLQREGGSQLAELTEEQREEINEAVRAISQTRP